MAITHATALAAATEAMSRVTHRRLASAEALHLTVDDLTDCSLHHLTQERNRALDKALYLTDELLRRRRA